MLVAIMLSRFALTELHCGITKSGVLSASDVQTVLAGVGIVSEKETTLLESEPAQGRWVMVEVQGKQFRGRPIVAYIIGNGLFVDFCFFPEMKAPEEVLGYFKKRWLFLIDGIDKGMINHTEAGGASLGEVARAMEMFGDRKWPTGQECGNIKMNDMRAAYLLRYVNEISEIIEVKRGGDTGYGD